MPEKESMHPDLEDALRRYEREMLDGTERSQKQALETLRLTRKRLLGKKALAAEAASDTQAA